MVHRRQRLRVAGLVGVCLVVGLTAAASADTGIVVAPCSCLAPGGPGFGVPVEPPVGVPDERVYGPVGAGLGGVVEVRHYPSMGCGGSGTARL
jgi:hypothetical protein